MLNTAQVVVRKGLFSDVERLRKEAARPDGVIEVPDRSGALTDDFQFNTRTDLSMAHVQMAQDAKNAIDLKGPNATAMGDKAQGSSAASGKAILASQQGGMVSLGDLLDNLRHLDIRVFRAIWNRVRQYWTAEKWIRVTDDERNVKWVGLNVDPSRVQMASPEQQQMIAGVVGRVAELDCDITIDEAPDSVVPALEQFEALVTLKQFDLDGEIPLIEMVKAVPNLKNRVSFIKGMEERAQQRQQNPAAQAGEKLQLAGAEAEVADKRAAAMLKEAQARKAMADAGAGGPEGPSEIDLAKALADIRNTQAGTEKTSAETRKIEVETALKPLEMRNQQRDREISHVERKEQFRQKATQAA